jgi:hypothetical protein
VKRGTAFPSKYISKADVESGPLRGAIEVCQPEEVGQGEDKETKPVLYLKGMDKGVIVNQTVWDQISEIANEKGIPDPDDSDNWVGLSIELYHDPSIKFGSKKVGGVRVRKPAAVTRTQGATIQRPAAARPPADEEPEYMDEDAPPAEDGPF